MTVLTDHQTTIFLDRYAKRDKDNKPVEQDVEQMWQRVADFIAQDEADRQAYLMLMRDFKFVPGGRILAGAGTEAEKTFYNCYVIPVEARHPTDHYPLDYPGDDSREAIFDTRKTMVDIMSRGGGVGINWSVLRPAGSYLTRVSGTSSGPVGWMHAASVDVGEVIQGGSRRGAAMFMLDDWHPDVLSFIDAKRDNTRITNANISVAVSDEFMEAVRDDLEWELVFPDTSHKAYNREWHGDIHQWRAKGYPVRVYATVRARDIWRRLADGAHASGEPGVVFLGRYNALSTGAGVERIISVNPCGEQGLGAYSVCNLASLNLAAYVIDGDFAWERFRKDIATATRFLDDVIDRTHYSIPATKTQQMKLRRIGLGVMGLADALVMLGLRYGSPEAVRFAQDIFKSMKECSIMESNRLAALRGSCGGWEYSMWDRPYLKDAKGVDKAAGMRNMFLLTQAPTGTTSVLAGVNSGIEPFFALEWTRVDRTGTHQVRPAVLDGMDLQERPDFVVTSNEVTVEEHIAMQAAVQAYVDSSVSKTINAPKGQSVDEVEKAFTLAYESGLKGVAYYRDGSRDVQVLYREDPNKRIRELEEEVEALKGKLNFRTRVAVEREAEKADNLCPACEIGTVVHEEGCMKCHSCGWSAC